MPFASLSRHVVLFLRRRFPLWISLCLRIRFLYVDGAAVHATSSPPSGTLAATFAATSAYVVEAYLLEREACMGSEFGAGYILRLSGKKILSILRLGAKRSKRAVSSV